MKIIVKDIHNDSVYFEYDPKHLPRKYDTIIFDDKKFQVHRIKHFVKHSSFGGVNALEHIEALVTLER